MGLPNRRQAFTMMLGLLCTSAPSAQKSVHPSAWPVRPVRIIVPFPPGGVAGDIGQAMAHGLGASLDQPVVVVHVAGAGGIVGTTAAAKSAADGHTLLVGTVATHAINVSLFRSLPYDPLRDFVPVALLMESPHLLVMHAQGAERRGIHTVADLIAYASSHPGELNMASSGNGTSSHLAGELFKSLTGVAFAHVPYQGSAPAMRDLLGGSIDLMFDTLSSSVPHIRSGRLTALAIAAATRSAALPTLPTMEELGIPQLKGFAVQAWWGLFAPYGVAPEIVERLRQEVAKVLATDAMKVMAETKGAVLGHLSGPAFADYIASETKKWAEIVKASGARPD